MRKKKNGVSLLEWIMYGIMVLLTFVLLFISKEKYKIMDPVDQQYKGTIEFLTGWVDIEDNPVDLEDLHENKNIKPREEFRVYHSIPRNIEEGYTLNIAAKNIAYELYVDGIQLKDVYNPNEQDVQKCFGRRYSMVPIEKGLAGKRIEMKLILVYSDKSSTFLDMSLGLPQGYLLNFGREKVISLVVSMLFLFVSLLLVLVDIPINMGKNKNHELLALGSFSFAVGMWGLVSTHCTELFTGDGRTTQITACLFLALIVLPLLIYIRDSMGFFSQRELNVYATLYFVEFLAVWIMEITGIADVQSTLKLTHITLAIGILLLISIFFRKREEPDTDNHSKFFHMFRTIGFTALLAGSIADLIRYYRKNLADNAIFVRFGLLLFIICFGVSSLEKTIRAVKIGAKAEFISHLAYQDGLTNLSNRTAFNEKLELLQAKQQNVAIIMFDVNDLKKVNDNLGHQYGDEMLVTSARLIYNVFGAMGGECYRIGGDEFVVILSKENMRQAVTDGLGMFKENVDTYNEQDNLSYQIRIAYGYAILEDEKCSIMELYEVADQRMYECKKKMKAQIQNV